MGFGKFWKFMEIENAIFQDLENFGKERIFYKGERIVKMPFQNFEFLFGKILKNFLKWMQLSFVFNTVCVMFFSFYYL